MWTERRFVITRNPAKGGLHFAYIQNLTEELTNEIRYRCMELMASEEGTGCLAVCPLKKNYYAVAMARKVNGSAVEPRPHHVVRGVVVDRSQLELFYTEYIPGKKIERIFFPEEVDPDKPCCWVIPEEFAKYKDVASMKMNEVEPAINRFWKKIRYTSVVAFYEAVNQVARQGLHVQLAVPPDKAFLVLAAICDMADKTGKQLFVAAGGECTSKYPDILLTNEIQYMDEQKYQLFGLERFLRLGEGRMIEIEHGQEEQKDPVLEVMGICHRFMRDPRTSEYEVFEAAGNLMMQDKIEYCRFQRMLRKELETAYVAISQEQRFFILLYLAYQKIGANDNPVPELQTAPYEFDQMYGLLKRRTKSKKRLRRQWDMLMELQTEACAGKVGLE